MISKGTSKRPQSFIGSSDSSGIAVEVSKSLDFEPSVELKLNSEMSLV